MAAHAQDQPTERHVDACRAASGRFELAAGVAPLGQAVLQTEGALTATSEVADGVVGVDAVGAAAVGDDVAVVGEIVEPVELVGWDVDGTGEVPGRVLGGGADVDDDDVAAFEAGRELLARDGVDAIAVAEVVARELVEALQPRAAMGARLLAPAGAELGYAHRALRDGDEVDLGGLTLRVIATPGHTPEHLAYLLADRSRSVRQDTELAEGHVPGATHVELGTLLDQTDAVPDAPVVVHCGHGERAMSAASLLERAGHDDVAVLAGSPQELAELETGTRA